MRKHITDTITYSQEDDGVDRRGFLKCRMVAKVVVQ